MVEIDLLDFEEHTRGDFLRRVAVGGGALIAGGVTLAELAPGARAGSPALDQFALNVALILEELGVRFYGEALKKGKLTGETKTFVKTAYGHELEHRRLVRSLIAKPPRRLPKFEFGPRTSETARVQETALRIENISTQTLVGAAPLLTRATLAKAGPLLPVEARHVAWISNIMKRNPAPRSFQPGGSGPQAKVAIKPFLAKGESLFGPL